MMSEQIAEDSNRPYPWEAHYPAGVVWDAPVEPHPVDCLLERAVARYGPRPALDFMGKVYTYKELGDLVFRAAKGFQDIGIQKGMRVGLFLPNTPYFVICYYALMKIGAVVVNMNPLYAEQELEHLVKDSDTELVVTLDLSLFMDKIAHVLSTTTLNRLVVCSMADVLPFPKNILFKMFRRKDIANVEYTDRILNFDTLVYNDGLPKDIEIDVAEDVAVFQYTGGTTGVPKAAMLTHQNIYANTLQAALWFHKCTPGEERVLGVLPFFHAFAMTTVMNLSVYYGIKIIAVPKFELKETLKLIVQKKPTLFPAVPAIYNAILNHPKIDAYDLSSIKYCISGGAPLPLDTKQQFESKTGCALVEGYGLSETSPVACCNPIGGVNKEGSIGVPLPHTYVDIRDPEEPDVVKTTGEVGEICISGPQVMKGYHNKPEATAKTVINGRLHTGDLGYMDEDGFIFIVDRLKDMIITNGYNVYPRNVEEAIYQHPAVEECVVAGLPDPQRGEVIKAWIKPVDGKTLSKEDMKIFLEDKISPIEIPRHFEFRTAPLPKTLIGKLSRKDLVEGELEST